MKLRLTNQRGRESLYIAEVQHFLRAVNGSGNVLRLGVCMLHVAQASKHDSGMVRANLPSNDAQSQAVKVMAVDISELDTKLVTAKEGSKLFGMVSKVCVR